MIIKGIKYYTHKEAAVFMSTGESTVSNLRAKGAFANVTKVGKSFRIPEQSILDYLAIPQIKNPVNPIKENPIKDVPMPPPVQITLEMDAYKRGIDEFFDGMKKNLLKALGLSDL